MESQITTKYGEHMDLQTTLNNMMKARRADDMLNSEQLTVGELLLKLEGVTNTDLPVVFDDGTYKPTGIDSWRGSYRELAFGYSKVGEDGRAGTYNSEEIETDYPEYGITEYKKLDAGLPTLPLVRDVIELLERIKGKTFTGYKGGNYLMGKSTPLWVALYGSSSGWLEPEGDKYEQAVVDLVEAADAVSIVTKLSSH